MEPRQDVPQPDADKALLKKCLYWLDVGEPYHKNFCRKADHSYSLWRNVQDWNTSVRDASERDRDAVVKDGQGIFGRELFIPIAFGVIETIVPRMLASRPEMHVNPRNSDSVDSAANMAYLIDAQQQQINYQLRLQTIGKDGLMYGTGVQKCYWREKYRRSQQLVPSENPGTDAQFVPQSYMRKVFDDPDAKAVDPRDFIPDPFASDIGEAEFAFHRTWRTNRYIKDMAEAGVWRNLDAITDVDLTSMGDGPLFDQLWDARLKAGGGSGTGHSIPSAKGKQPLHEVLEFHDGDQVITIIDRCLVVQSGENPNWHGELPFQLFTPTEVTHEIYGMSEIEPIEQLQDEMNTLRTQRRYNADLVLQKVFAYQDGSIREEDLKFGPGYAIPTDGDPSQLLMAIPVGDIPYSGYQEEDRLKADIDRTAGLSDALQGAGDTSQTATGAQLVASAASLRIQNKLVRLELQVVNPGTSQFGALNQQKILTNREVRIPSKPTPGNPDDRWAWLQLGPGDLAGEMEYECESLGSLPENIPQDRADGQTLNEMFGQSPQVDQAKLTSLVLGKYGIKRPESLLAPPDPKVPAEALNRIQEELITELGMDPDQAGQLVARGLAAAGGPDLSAPDPTQGSGANPDSPDGAPPADAPQPQPAAAGGSQ